MTFEKGNVYKLADILAVLENKFQLVVSLDGNIERTVDKDYLTPRQIDYSLGNTRWIYVRLGPDFEPIFMYSVTNNDPVTDYFQERPKFKVIPRVCFERVEIVDASVIRLNMSVSTDARKRHINGYTTNDRIVSFDFYPGVGTHIWYEQSRIDHQAPMEVKRVQRTNSYREVQC